MKLLSNTTEVINYFSQSYAVETKENFRTDSYSGEAPVEMARKKGIGRHCGSKGSTDTCKGKGNY